MKKRTPALYDSSAFSFLRRSTAARAAAASLRAGSAFR